MADVVLEPATPAQKPLIENLVELYVHDLSDAFELNIGENGRFGYESLPLYWSEPEIRFPFLIREGDHVAGFVLVMRVGEHWDIAEFFVLRRHRRNGVGREAAFQTWSRFRGPWSVRVLIRNEGALQFWSAIIEEYTNGEMTTEDRDGWRVFGF